jgi:hypothetical protein
MENVKTIKSIWRSRALVVSKVNLPRRASLGRYPIKIVIRQQPPRQELKGRCNNALRIHKKPQLTPEINSSDLCEAGSINLQKSFMFCFGVSLPTSVLTCIYITGRGVYKL